MIIDTEECIVCKCYVSEGMGTLFMGFIANQETVFVCFDCQDKRKEVNS